MTTQLEALSPHSSIRPCRSHFGFMGEKKLKAFFSKFNSNHFLEPVSYKLKFPERPTEERQMLANRAIVARQSGLT